MEGKFVNYSYRQNKDLLPPKENEIEREKTGKKKEIEG